jgi:hypothetical protein
VLQLIAHNAYALLVFVALGWITLKAVEGT